MGRQTDKKLAKSDRLAVRTVENNYFITTNLIISVIYIIIYVPPPKKKIIIPFVWNPFSFCNITSMYWIEVQGQTFKFKTFRIFVHKNMYYICAQEYECLSSPKSEILTASVNILNLMFCSTELSKFLRHNITCSPDINCANIKILMTDD